MYDSFGDGWNGGNYSIIDSVSGNILYSGCLLTGLFGTDPLCFGPSGCIDSSATNFDPNAIVDDGFLDFTLIKNVSKLQVISQIPNLFKGTHVNHPKIDTLKTYVDSTGNKIKRIK